MASTGPKVHEAVVVGAGMAGLACGLALRSHLDDLVLLEARDRVGGRVRTDRTLAPGLPVELGALYVHGRRAATHRLLRHYGLAVRPVPVLGCARFARSRQLHRFPAWFRPWDPDYGTLATFEGLVALPRALARYRGPDLPLAAFLNRWGPRAGARQLLELLEAHASAAEAGEIGVLGPAAEARLAPERFGFANYRVVGGYDLLAQAMARELGDRLRLGVAVEAVRWEAGRVLLEARGPWGREEVAARRAVLTLPLGVLKAGAVAFQPELPPPKRRAVGALAMGQALTVELRLEGGNLAEGLGEFALLWGGGPTSFHRPRAGLRGPELLQAFTVGREAARRSRLPEAEAAAATLGELRALLPAALDPGEVVGHRVAPWPAEPFTLGGYSFLPPGVGPEARRALAAPVASTLFFAGEATHARGGAGTVHGALETGWRAARELLASLGVPPP